MSILKVGPVRLRTLMERGTVVWYWHVHHGEEFLRTGDAPTQREAQAAADAELEALRLEMLRDLLSGPEWEGLGEALEHGAQALDNKGGFAPQAALLRKLAAKLEVTP